MKNVLVISMVAISAFAIVMSSSSVSGFETSNIAAYLNHNCTDAVSTIDWGVIRSGSSKNVTIYLKNEGSAPITLSLATANWNPSNAERYMSISWDYSGEQIGPGNVIQVTLTLTVSRSLSGVSHFTVDVIITGAG